MSGAGATRGSYPLLQRGMPFFAFIVGGSYGVSILLQVRAPSHIDPRLALPRQPSPYFGHPITTDAPHHHDDDDREGTT